MFDIDGTLVESYELDTRLFSESVNDVTGINIDTNWSRYTHATDTGILHQFFNEHNIRNRVEAEQEIKYLFLEKLKQAFAREPLQEIPGASAFIEYLKSKPNIVLSIATGGWLESAVLKLESAGIHTDSIAIASSNDHYSRTEIMKIAAFRATAHKNCAWTYFGDGIWDKKACEDLGINFVLVGNGTEHYQCIESFESLGDLQVLLGLDCFE